MFLFADTICNNYSLLHIQNRNIFATPFFDSKFLILSKMQTECDVNTGALLKIWTFLWSCSY